MVRVGVVVGFGLELWYWVLGRKKELRRRTRWEWDIFRCRRRPGGYDLNKRRHVLVVAAI